MKPRDRSGIIMIPMFAALIVLHLVLAHPLSGEADHVCVGVTSAALHETPSVDSPRTGTAGKGTRLEVLERQGKWLKVHDPNTTEGWIEIGSIDETCGKEPVREKSAREGSGPLLTLKVTMSAVNIRRDPDGDSQWVGSARKNDILIGLEEKNGWFRCKTTDGKEGWVIASSCAIVPLHAESARTELRHVIVNCDEMTVRAGPSEDYPSLGMLKMDREAGVFLEEGDWVYIKETDEKMEGWVKNTCVYDPERNQNLAAWKEDVLNLSEKLITYYDQKKKETGAYREVGWYPSFSLFFGENDVTIEPLPDGWRLGLTLSTRRISIDTLFPLSVETIPLSLSKADRLFFLTLLQAIMENEQYTEVTIHLKGLKRNGTVLTWVDAGGFTLRKKMIQGIDLDKLGPEEFWNLLDHS
ncbi:MAG: SH3 domain-containing protein [bacterium]